jgi:hypothetical protein
MWIMVEPIAEIPFGICRSPTQCYGCDRSPNYNNLHVVYMPSFVVPA